MIAQAWGHNPGERVLGAPQLYLFEPHQTEQMGWKPDVFLDGSPVWEKKRLAMECMNGQVHLWEYYTRVAQQRAKSFSSATRAVRPGGGIAAMRKGSRASFRVAWTGCEGGRADGCGGDEGSARGCGCR